MGEGRNENLVNALDIEKKAKRKAMKHTALIILFAIMLFLVVNFISDEKVDICILIVISIPIDILFFICYFFLVKVYKDMEIENINTLLAESCLSTKSLTKVIPIKAYYYKEFILGLEDIAEFYAKISEEDDEYVEVWVILNEGSKRFLEIVYKGEFLNFYSIVEENKQDEK